MPSKPRVLYWFRTDLRLHDSPALHAALDLKPECLYPIWCWDPHYVYRARVGPNRWQFLLDCQSDLSSSIIKLNKKSKLFVIREAPQTVLPKLFKAWKITHLVFERDTDPYAKQRDAKAMELAREAGVEVIATRHGRTLHDPDELVKANGGKPTMSITQVQHAAEKIGDVPQPLPAPDSLPDPGDLSLDFEQTQPSPEPDINSIQRNSKDTSYASISGPNHDFAVPTASELGLKPATTPHRGGETRALAALDAIIADELYTTTFSKPSTAPTAFSPQATTLLSPHHHFGSLSVRLFYHRVLDVTRKPANAKKATTIPTNLIGQLLFRDMYFAAQAAIGYPFAQTYNNSHVRFIPWHLPSRIDPETNLITGDHIIDSPLAEKWFQRWKYGRTGFPWIDALMRQLRQEGWIHHLGRHAVACFLTRGGCYIDWERGAEVFEEWLIDHETSCNSGNWQWLSCTAFFAQFYRCYSPVAFPKKWDEEGAFVKRYVPELGRYPKKYVYEPWKAPIKDQKEWGCMVKGDGGDGNDEDDGKGGGKVKLYPKPMFDFNERRGICIAGVKNAYHVGLYGDDPKVKDGTWRKLFDDDAEGPTEGTKGPTVEGQTNAEDGEDLDAGNMDIGIDQDEREADHVGGETKGGDKTPRGGKRKRGQGTLDGHFESPRKRKGKGSLESLNV
ncbi:MAG: hypothetical protein LQ343_006480 [Gyalolechia ehrenbergii]|nr:MAG: hypothetical protein LQ343_006480 [Gyalolechia ehrenbergii]